MSDWNAPETELLASVLEHLDRDEPAMLATVVDVEGSAYRRPGAKTLVPPSGDAVGAITAGCLEDEVRRLAENVLATGERQVETFDLRGDGDGWGLGVGCNGVVDLLLEPLDGSFRRALEAYHEGEAVTVATVVETDDDRLTVGDREYLDDLEQFPEDVAAALRDRADGRATGDAHAVTTDESRTVTVDADSGTVRVFLDRVTPPPRLLVVGLGQDVRPVTELGRDVGFRVTVAGFRGARATDERFPAADRVVSTSPAELTDALAVDERTYAVVMTHNFVDDRIAVADLLDSPSPYVGLMGPPERYEDMREAASAEGRSLPAMDPALYTPVGLDLGGDTPYQVAHSIVAEALAVHNDRNGGHLRGADHPIHGRAPRADGR